MIEPKPIIQPWVFELIGTFFLVLAGSGAAQMAAQESHTIGLMAGAVSVGAVLFISITLFGPVSGAHFNPAVSLAFRIHGKINNPTLARYMAAQVLGGLLAMWCVHLMFGLSVFEIAKPSAMTFGLGLSEFLMTAGLVLIIFFAIQQNSTQIPTIVALFVVAGYFMSSSSIIANPAVALARFFTQTPTAIGMPKVLWFIGIEFVAGALAAWLMRPKRTKIVYH